MARRIRLLVAAALVAASAVVVAVPTAGSAGVGVVVAGPERCC